MPKEKIAKPVVFPKIKLPGEAQKAESKEAMRVATDSAEVFQLMENRDEQQMMQEILGVYSKEYVYDIPFRGGKVSKCDTPGCPLAKQNIAHTHVRGLSWSGIKEARRIFQGIDCDVLKPALIEEDGKKYYETGAKAVDLRTGNASKSFKRQSLLKKKKSGEFIEDPFAYEIVQSKAKRNAIAEILPQPLVKMWITDWLKGKKDFNPKYAINLKKGQDFTINGQEDETLKANILDEQMKRIHAQFTNIEKLGGRTVEKSRTDWKKYFKIKSMKQLTIPQATKIIENNKRNIERLSPGNRKQPPKALGKNKKVEMIKEALVELGWDLENPTLVETLLQPHGVNSIKDLDKAAPEALDAILVDLGN